MISWITRILSQHDTDLSQVLDRDPIILDVREPYEFEGRHIDIAINIPLSEVYTRWQELKAENRPIIAYCRSGMRSGKAVNLLKEHRIEAYNGGGIRDMEGLLSAQIGR